LLVVGVGLWQAREDKPTDYQGRKPGFEPAKGGFFGRVLVGGVILLVLIALALAWWVK
jgi:hypothetical protein